MIARSERVLKSLCPNIRERVVHTLEENGVRLFTETQVLEVLSSGTASSPSRPAKGGWVATSSSSPPA